MRGQGGGSGLEGLGGSLGLRFHYFTGFLLRDLI